LQLTALAAMPLANHLGLPDLKEADVDYFVGHTLEIVWRELLVQVKLAVVDYEECDVTLKFE